MNMFKWHCRILTGKEKDNDNQMLAAAQHRDIILCK